MGHLIQQLFRCDSVRLDGSSNVLWNTVIYSDSMEEGVYNSTVIKSEYFTEYFVKLYVYLNFLMTVMKAVYCDYFTLCFTHVEIQAAVQFPENSFIILKVNSIAL